MAPKCASPISRRASNDSSATYRPPQIIRRIEPLAGLPRIAIRVRPTHDYGRPTTNVVVGSNHIRYIGGARGAASDHRRAALLYRQGDHLSADPAGDPGVRPGRAVPQRHRHDQPRISRPHPRLLAGLGAQSRCAVRMADGGRPRGDHPQIVQLRGDRRHRRRAHHLDPGSAVGGRELGLPLSAGCATPISSSRR